MVLQARPVLADRTNVPVADPGASKAKPGASAWARGRKAAAPQPAGSRQTAPMRRPRPEALQSEPEASPQTKRLATGTPQPQTEMLDVDRLNAHNELCVSEYACDIFQNLKAEECTYRAPSGYMAEVQKEINTKMRAILMDWLVEVHYKFKLQSDVLHLAVNLVDRYLSKVRLQKKVLQLVGVTCMFIAAKYEEIFPPEITDFVHVTDGAYTREEIIEMEIKILNTLRFNVSVPLAVRFLQRYLTVLGVGPVGVDLKGAKSCAKRWHLAHYMLELTLTDYRMLQYKPSMLACAAMFLSERLLVVGKLGASTDVRASWPPALQQYTGYTDAMIRPCTKDILTQLVSQGQKSTNLHAVYRKYSRASYGSVAVIPEVEKVVGDANTRSAPKSDK